MALPGKAVLLDGFKMFNDDIAKLAIENYKPKYIERRKIY